LALPTKSVLKNKKKHAVHNIYRLALGIYVHGAPMLVVSPGNYPACPCAKMALYTKCIGI